MPNTSATQKKYIRFNIRNVHYAILNEDGSYGTPKPLAGARKFSYSPEGESTTFYADGIPWAVLDTNAGYSGDYELAYLEDAAAADILSEVQDAIGGMYEDVDKQPKRVAVMWEFQTNYGSKFGVFYDVTFSRPSMEGNTSENSTTPDTTTLSYTAVPVKMKVGEETHNVTKYSVEYTDDSAAVCDAWFTQVQKPVAATA